MAKLGKEIIFEVGDDGIIKLRQPTNKEWNQYNADKIDAQMDGRDVEASNRIMCELFDTLVTEITNIEDADDTKITLTDLTKINAKEKASMIMQGIELNSQGISIKN